MPALPRFSEQELLRRYAVATDLSPRFVVDVGAHVGRFSEAFAQHGFHGVAFEAEPDNAARLRERMDRHEGWSVREQAVTDTTGTMQFHRSSEFWGIHSLAPTTASHDDVIEVQGTTLRAALEDLGVAEVGLLKIDVEGADLPALRSFPFDRCRPAVVMAEIMDDRSRQHFGWDHHEMVRFMAGHGYSALMTCWADVEQHSRESGGGGPFDFLRAVPYPAPTDPAWGNVVFVPEDDFVGLDAVLLDYLHDLAVDVRERSASIDGLRATVDARDARIDELQAAVRQRDARKDELQAAVDQRDARIEELDAAVAQRDARIDELQAVIGQRDARIERLQLSLGRGAGDVGSAP